MKEDQYTISLWADSVVGPASSNMRIAVRANQEMSELMTKLAINDRHSTAGEEIADTMICLMRLATRLGVNIEAAIDAKMEVNRKRKWTTDGTGCGQHIPE